MRFHAAALIAAAFLLTGCKSSQPGQRHLVQRGQAPEYAKVAAAYNKRVEPLSRLFAYIVLRLQYIDEDGEKHQDQVEGGLSFVPPHNVFLHLDKAGVTIGALGSNDESYWWVELSDHKRALVGEHDRATPDRLKKAGVPVHPLDLIELAGITPIPESGSVGWSTDGKSLVVTVPGRFGSRRLLVDPEDHRPNRIELLDANAAVVASSDLSKYEVVAIPGAGPGVPHGSIATDIQIVASGGDTRGHFELSQPSVDPSHTKPALFDLQRLLESKDVKDVRHLDPPDK